MKGVKVLAWDREGGPPFSPMFEIPWLSATMAAECRSKQVVTGRSAAHRAPFWDCNCGIHASSAMYFLLEFLSHPHIGFFGRLRCDLFTVLLEASGEVIVHDYGWRSATATVVAVGMSPDLLSPAEPAERGSAYFGVPFPPGYELIEMLQAEAARGPGG